MMSAEKQGRDVERGELGTTVTTNEEPAKADVSRDISPEKDEKKKVDSEGEREAEEKEKKGSIKDYFVSLSSPMKPPSLIDNI